MKTKRMTLVSGNELDSIDKWHWTVMLNVGRSGIIYDTDGVNARKERAYYLENQEKFQRRSRDWNKENKEQKAENGKKWYRLNRDKTIQRAAKWADANQARRREIALKHAKRYWRRYKANRRGMGFKPLNDVFDGSHGHHVNNDQVIYIPEDTHRSVYHNLRTGQGMAEINALAFRYLFEHTHHIDDDKQIAFIPRGH